MLECSNPVENDVFACLYARPEPWNSEFAAGAWLGRYYANQLAKQLDGSQELRNSSGKELFEGFSAQTFSIIFRV